MWKFGLVLGWGVVFQRFELTLSLSGFSRQLKMQSELEPKIRMIIAGKSLKKNESKIAILNFTGVIQ